jgi:hypothetical protein
VSPYGTSRLRSALAGGAAALVWALEEPLDERVFRCDYSDVALLGKAVTRGPRWRIAGLAVHVTNGALFGVAFHEARRSIRLRTSLTTITRRAVSAAFRPF